jgi:hypothetical protein
MKFIALVVFVFAIVLNIYAVEVDEYLIGAYSQYQLRYVYSDFETKYDSLGAKLKRAGFNATAYSVFDSDDFPNNLGIALAKMDHNNIRTILQDMSWLPSSSDQTAQPGDDRIGVMSLSYGNYKKMEAEYQLKYDDNGFVPDVLPENDNTGDDEYNYVFRHETGHISDNLADNASNRYVWICDSESDDSGLALSYPRFRWKPNAVDNPRTIGYDYKFRGRALAENRLYLTVAMDFGGADSLEAIADIHFKVLKNSAILQGDNEYTMYVENDTNYYEFDLIPVHPTYETTIYQQDYPSVQIDNYQNYLFEYYLELPGLDNPLHDQLMTDEYFFHINPQVYWHGHGRLEIDYIILQDKIYRDIDNYWGRLQDRLNQIDNVDTYNNILYHYAKDEPFQGQYRIYPLIEDYLENHDKHLITATHYDNPSVNKPLSYPNYSHYGQFLQVANPKRILLDAYPLKEDGISDSDLIKWNDETNPRFVQTWIQSLMLNFYSDLAHNIKHNPSYNDTELMFVPQIFGERLSGTDPATTTKWKYLMPPRSMIKCLQLMPLCYAADGIVSFAIASNPNNTMSNGLKRVAPLSYSGGYSNLSETQYSSAYDQLSEANQKIAVYGPLIKDLNWVNTDCIMTYGGIDNINIGEFLLDELRVLSSGIDIPLYSNRVQPYQGYVQCGYYQDDTLSPYFMLVNRRSVIRSTNSGEVIQLPVDDNFYDADPQVIRFVPAEDANLQFGTLIAMYDPYDESLITQSGPNIDVEIGPGDGRLLQMCATLPETVLSDETMNHFAVIEGDITIGEGASVTISPGCNSIFKDNTCITIQDGASLTINGVAKFGDNVRFNIDSDSIVEINDAVCNINRDFYVEGEGFFVVGGNTVCNYIKESDIIISDGSNVILSGVHNYGEADSVRISEESSLTYQNAVLNLQNNVRIKANMSSIVFSSCSINLSSTTCGDSIIIENLSTLSIENSSVRNCPILVSGSDFSLEDSSIYVMEGTTGISISNPFTDRTVCITGNQERTVIVGESSENTTGVDIQISHSPVVISDTDFSGLQNGLTKSTTAPDSLSSCSFTNCMNGFAELSSGATGRIEDCAFTDIGSVGVYLSGSLPTVQGCTFNACCTGIFFDGVFYSPRESGIYSSAFNLCGTAIESRGSNSRVLDCSLYLNDIGILNHVDSNLNLSQDASNQLQNVETNIKFLDSEDYHSYIQLESGHNDFFHFGQNTLDFCFDEYYYSTNGYAINANKNWFENDEVMINDPPLYDHNVLVVDFDPFPNTIGTPPDGTNRYLMALHLEATGEFDQAVDLYQIILDDELESEAEYFNGCVDGIYRIQILEEIHYAQLEQYLELKIGEYTAVDSSFCKLLSDYLIRTYVAQKDFQSAIDIIQTRIDNPASDVDSLRAVLDLEIVLQLAAMEEDKRPIYTKYRGCEIMFRS